jgi:hypothetical protein
MFRWLFKPRPYPAFVLLAIIISGFGVLAVRPIVPILGDALVVAALVLLISFIRGLKQDLEVSKVGIVATAHITNIEVVSGTYRKRKYRVWQVYYTFQDLNGITHDDVMPIDTYHEARKYHAGGTAQLRYHPNNPEICRWLG